MKKVQRGPMREMYKGHIFTIKQQDVVLPNGAKALFEYCERPSSVSVLAFNNKKELLMIKEWRLGYDKNVWFLPGGRIDHKNDTPKKAAQRELREETGYRANTMKLVHKKSPASTLHWDIYVYAAKDLEIDPLPLDTGEIIIPQFVSLKKAVQMALDGTIENEFISYNIIRFDYMMRHGEFTW